MYKIADRTFDDWDDFEPSIYFRSSGAKNEGPIVFYERNNLYKTRITILPVCQLVFWAGQQCLFSSVLA